ncbi:hypothetical protein Vretimale_2348 [Volvox reticuliferus]|uniref:Uncharacterized protein n=1 Tax=Volvox reticuliferus TaxID=1737510 RepID=A0A8J4C7K1_9CHLO|nr:hypothetical protein Vretifemale_4693 [Volvox reticuliferus]GIL96626.1 hypothetical protein Vretimale_2348 [Volvox reticuliferus]
MSKKRQRREDEQPAEGVPAITASAGEAAAMVYGGASTEHTDDGHSGRRQKSLVNPETASYLEDVVAHFKTLVDDEERALLVGNVLEEILGKEVKVAGDPVCSRHVETLMAAASAEHLLKFLTSVSDVNGFFLLVSSPFGSHVVEKLLIRLESQLDVLTQEEYDEFHQVMKLLTDSICPHLYDYVTDRFATHVARRLLCLLAGRNVLPPPSKQRQQQLPGLENKRSKLEVPTGLAAKLGGVSATAAGVSGKKHSSTVAALAAELLGSGADEPPPCRLPELVSCFTAVVCSDDYVGAVVSELVYHPYACPFLQALLRAAACDRKALRQLVPVLLGATSFNDSVKGGAGAVLEGCREEEVSTMLTDPTTSHLMEALLQVLPRALLEEFFRRFLGPRLAELAHHPSANFVVQTVLVAAPSKEMAKTMYDSLSGLLPDLLRKRRSGVVVALVACCGRHGICQREVCAALASALSGMPQWAALKGDAVLAPALLCLDSLPVIGSNEPFSAATVVAARGGSSSLPRLSPTGCSILTQILRYGQGACRSFTDSVASLKPHDAARVGADPSGSRVLEALLEGNAPAKVKGALLSALADHWDAVAATASGSFLVETALRWADMRAKEAIVSRLAAASKALEVTHWGPALLRKVGAEAYSRDPEQWRRHVASATKTMDQFTKLFGDDVATEKSQVNAKRKDAADKEEENKERKMGKMKRKREAALVLKEDGEERPAAAAKQEDGKKAAEHGIASRADEQKRAKKSMKSNSDGAAEQVMDDGGQALAEKGGGNEQEQQKELNKGSKKKAKKLKDKVKRPL